MQDDIVRARSGVVVGRCEDTVHGTAAHRRELLHAAGYAAPARDQLRAYRRWRSTFPRPAQAPFGRMTRARGPRPKPARTAQTRARAPGSAASPSGSAPLGSRRQSGGWLR